MSIAHASILVVDDEPGIQRALVQILVPMGYDVCVADSARSALELLAHRWVDIVLCDLRLEGCSGLDMQKALRARTTAIPAFVLMSGQAGPGDVAQAFRQGGADFVQKPFTHQELRDTLDRVLALRGPRPESEAGAGPTTPPAARPLALRFEMVPEVKGGPVERPPMQRVSGWPRIVETLRRAAKGGLGRLALDDSNVRIDIQIGAMSGHPGLLSSGEGTIEVKVLDTTVADPALVVPGAGCAIWFSDPEGICGFRTTVVGCTLRIVALAQPDSLIRYSRRRSRRVPLPPGSSPRVVLPLSDGTCLELDEAVTDISTGGMSLVLPIGLAPPVGAVVNLGVAFRGALRTFTLAARVRRAAPQGDRAMCGVEFVEMAPTARIAIQRFVERLEGGLSAASPT